MDRNDDLTLLALANGLDSLGQHAAAMAPDEWHPLCMECQTMMLLTRVVVAGRHICELERTGP